MDSPVARRIGAMEFDGQTLILGYLTRSVGNGVSVLQENTSIGLVLFDQDVSHQANPACPSLGEFRSSTLIPIRDHVDNRPGLDAHLPESIETTLARPKPRQR